MRSGSGEPAARSYPDSFSEFAQKAWVYRNRGRGRTMGDTTPPIGADHGPTRTVPTSVSAVASLPAWPRRLADATPGAGVTGLLLARHAALPRLAAQLRRYPPPTAYPTPPG